jgi:hypothetical protein
MNLNKAIKEKIIKGLVSEAVKKHAAPTNKALKSVHELWKYAFSAEFKRQVPELKPERWEELLQAGVLQPVGRGSVYERTEKGSINASSVHIPFRVSETRVSDYDKERLVLARSIVNECISQASDVLTSYYSSHSGYTIYPDLSYADVPTCAGIGHVDPEKGQLPSPFQAHCGDVMPHSRKAVKRVCEIIQQTDELIEQLTDLLAPIRTEKQLATLLPEAMKYVPKQVKTSNVIPAEVYNDLRAKLEAGIPA